MENSIEKPRGLIGRISTLLNNEVCSDVVFHVRHNGQRGTFYAHSAILIAAGKGFPDLAKQTSQAKVIKVLEFSSHIVEMMLR
ncbi:hypothetical protein AVEN_7397-1 [Araneus ventricosus]|uniref:BTB domain-containing protein n=1 Tax=Araneus ventricosus TaxID=182803 RepID=A0A4Y2S743_ARAVE|nr:hypothetical protein AVEN_7397-1 [Araneus ventricosus]